MSDTDSDEEFYDEHAAEREHGMNRLKTITRMPDSDEKLFKMIDEKNIDNKGKIIKQTYLQREGQSALLDPNAEKEYEQLYAAEQKNKGGRKSKRGKKSKKSKKSKKNKTKKGGRKSKRTKRGKTGKKNKTKK
jgi:hypothetical protein